MFEAVYRLNVDDDEPVEVTVSALVSAWEQSIPDLAARVMDLPIGGSAVLFAMPSVRVTRLR